MRVLGRTGELAAIDDFLDGLSDGSSLGFCALLIIGVIGIGKTTLWDEARARARDRGQLVLSARPVEPETPLGFAALSDLFADVSAAIIDALPPPQSRALRVALLREDVGADPPDQRSVATASLGVLRTLATQQPVLLAIDDLAWLDQESARVLAFVLRRLGAEQVGLLASVRTEQPGGPSGQPELPTDAVDPARLTTVLPGSLSTGAIRELLDERLGFTASRRTLLRLHDASDGNPFFALELARTLGTHTELGDQLPVPQTLRHLVLERITDLAPAVRDTLLTAALAPGAPVAVIVSAGPDPSTALEQLESAEAAGIVSLQDAQVTFTHPLLRSVAVGDASPVRRRLAHRRLAQALPSPIERARHLALAADAPDAEVAGALDEAARDAYLHGAVETAAELGELAITLTPASSDGARRRGVTAAEYRFHAGDPARARTLLGEVVAVTEPSPQRASMLVQLAGYERYCDEPLPIWQATLTTALAEAGDDPDVRLACHLDLGFAAFNSADPSAGPGHVAAAAALVEQCHDRVLVAIANAAIAWAHFVAGHGVDRALAARAMAGYRSADRVPVEMSPPYTLAVMWAHVGDLDEARRLLEGERAEAISRGDETPLPFLLWLLVRVETWAGNWARADELCAEGLRAAELTGVLAGTALMLGSRVNLRARQGRVDDTRSDADRAMALSTQLALSLPAVLATEALGALALSQGDAAATHAALGSLAELALASGTADSGVLRSLPDEIEALVRLGDLDAAERLLIPFTARAAVPEGDWASVAAARCHGLLLAARGDVVLAEKELDRSVRLGRGLGMPFEQARTLLVAGEVHRRARHKRQAQARLTEAQTCFDQLGATMWSARCTAELERTRSGRAAGTASSRTATSLTETEQRVATMAAEGRTTREIASTLFTGVRTVEAHLQRIYRKLDVHSRVELSRRLAQQ